ncbi:hypothetical protein WIS52_12740 [Pseudonocardia nematodicida]|uniref:Uncharacterized protein n=1 Tax=Pseudonocardia nematodicida TaxID=1206997 RepID=A0ABV1KA40_9PSEU
MSTRGRRSRAGSDAAVRVVVDAVTRPLAARTTEAFDTRDLAAAIATRFGRHRLEHRAGHLFELWHKHSFNVDAIRKGASVRVEVTAACGEPTAAADLRIVDQGRVLDEVQAKLYGCAVAATRALARPKYRGMGRLVAEDRREQIERVLDKALPRDPDGIYQADYADVRTHLSDTVSHGDVRSARVSTSEVHRAAGDVARWGDRLAARAAGGEILAAAATGAALGGGLTGAVALVRETARVRAGETTAAEAACTAAGAAARSAVRSGTLAGLGTAARVALRTARVPAPLTGGGLPGAVASAVLGVSEAAISLARGDIDSAEFAAAGGEVTFQAGMAWAGGAVGQTVLPVPALGALVGGFVGQLSATLIVQGLQLAIEALRSDDSDGVALELLEAEAGAALETALLLSATGAELSEQIDASVGTTVVPLVDHALWTGIVDDPATGLAELVNLARQTDGMPLFVRVDEFDAWMADPLTSLSLSANWVPLSPVKARPVNSGPAPDR